MPAERMRTYYPSGSCSFLNHLCKPIGSPELYHPSEKVTVSGKILRRVIVAIRCAA